MKLIKLFPLILILISNIANARCIATPDIYGELEITSFGYHKEGNYHAIIDKLNNTTPNPLDTRPLNKNQRAALINGNFKKIKQIVNKKTHLEPIPTFSTKETRENYEMSPRLSEKIVAFTTENENICAQHPKGSKVYTEVFFYCCDKFITALRSRDTILSRNSVIKAN